MSYFSTECFFPDYQAIMLDEQLEREIDWVIRCKFLAAGHCRIAKSAGTDRPHIQTAVSFWIGNDRRWG